MAAKEIDPVLRRWIDNCIIPILISEYLSERNVQNTLAPDGTSVPQCTRKETASAKGVV
jgi:hypothetical protein